MHTPTNLIQEESTHFGDVLSPVRDEDIAIKIGTDYGFIGLSSINEFHLSVLELIKLPVHTHPFIFDGSGYFLLPRQEAYYKPLHRL